MEALEEPRCRKEFGNRRRQEFGTQIQPVSTVKLPMTQLATVSWQLPIQANQRSIMALLLPELMDELVEEVLLRLPLDSPAHLVHAALVCRRWRRLVSGAGFRRRLRAFHRSPPMLGFL
ncbi:hypothetical protein HU200_000463 [Digitaria exilis]|uniref:F-box domain-containing protein n=1 Tax=Digitaria exilis TaxID=1010633 RepID=A0A835G1U2_9POAL|nr:hypothetical protein HU200_000463 [Digitaria exilis]